MTMLRQPDPLTSEKFRSDLARCVHCGLCLQACPTYVALGTEMDSPRGRIALMRAVAEARLPPDELDAVFRTHLELCLSCLACQSACPSDVPYGSLVETVRLALAHRRPRNILEAARQTAGKIVRRVALGEIMPYVNRLKVLARVMRIYETSGLQKAVRRLKLLPGPLRAMEAILPPLPQHYADYRAPAPALGEKRGQVAFFIGCIQEAFLASVNEATVRVLQRNGYEVHFPSGQVCCGAAQLHLGDLDLARSLARRNIDAFLAGEYEAIINNAGGCGATLREEYVHLFADDPVYAERARRFSAQVQDISEFLVGRLVASPTRPVAEVAVYADSCHLRNVQKVVEQPRDLLRRIPGLTLVELQHPEHCCGSAGVYNIVHWPTADLILDLKLADIAATGASIVVVTNTGCHMQIAAGIRRSGLPARVLHLVQVLDMAYGNPAEDAGLSQAA